VSVSLNLVFGSFFEVVDGKRDSKGGLEEACVVNVGDV
jgi:hypothetical protein